MPQRPDENFQSPRKMKKRFGGGEFNACCRGHSVPFKFRLRILQRPGLVVNFSPINSVAMNCVKAITFGQPLYERTLRRRPHFLKRPIDRTECGFTTIAARGIANDPAKLFSFHCRVKIGQVIESPSGPHGGKIGGIQTKEINAGLPAIRHIGADIQLRKARRPREWRKTAAMNAAHMKRNHSDPALAVENIERELRWHKRPDRSFRHGPMCKQQIVPNLPHHPRPGWQRPWPMRYDA
jgi:hypothetical protein